LKRWYLVLSHSMLILVAFNVGLSDRHPLWQSWNLKASSDEYKYDLFGVVVHKGDSLQSGHYYAFVKHKEQWFQLDDTNVRTVTIQDVKSQKAYLLFYSRTHGDGQGDGVAGSRCGGGSHGDDDKMSPPKPGRMESLSVKSGRKWCTP
jgi:hypothetical protein